MPCSVSRVVIRFRFTELSAQLREAGRVIRPHSGLQVRRAVLEGGGAAAQRMRLGRVRGGSQDSTQPGELMVREAPSFRSLDAERGGKKQVLGSHWPCPQLLQTTGKPGCLQSKNLCGESPLGPLRPLGHQLRWLRQDRETPVSPTTVQINGPSVSILQTGKPRLKEEWSLAQSHPACEWYSLVGGGCVPGLSGPTATGLPHSFSGQGRHSSLHLVHPSLYLPPPPLSDSRGKWTKVEVAEPACLGPDHRPAFPLCAPRASSLKEGVTRAPPSKASCKD